MRPDKACVEKKRKFTTDRGEVYFDYLIGNESEYHLFIAGEDLHDRTEHGIVCPGESRGVIWRKLMVLFVETTSTDERTRALYAMRMASQLALELMK